MLRRVTHLDVSESPRINDEMFNLLEGPGLKLTHSHTCRFGGPN